MNDWYLVKNVDEIASPAVLIYIDRVEENIRRMIELVGDVTKLRPHVKTHKLPQLVALQCHMGIHKFKAATIAEADMTAQSGAKDILLAYPLVGPNIKRFCDLQALYSNTRFAALVDNMTTLQAISHEAVARDQVIHLYIDLNVGMNRTGIAPGDEAIDLYKAISNTPGVTAAGLHAYDGHIHEANFDTLMQKTTESFDAVWQMVSKLATADMKVPHIIASGTPTSKLLAKFHDVEVGAGTTVLWDFGQPEISPDLDFLNAAVVLARVISHPTSNRICIDVGHKAVASEMPHPRIRFFGLEHATPVVHSEEHLVLEVSDVSSYPVGTVLYGIPRHICPTVALHNEVQVIRNEKAEATWHVTARDRRINV
jgi:D-threonine aldolase